MKSLEGCLHATRVNVGEQWLVMNLVMKEGTEESWWTQNLSLSLIFYNIYVRHFFKYKSPRHSKNINEEFEKKISYCAENIWK